MTNRDALRAALAPLLADTDGVALADHLMAEGIPAGPVLEIPEVMEHPQVRARDMVVEQDGGRVIGTPIKMDRTPGDPRTPAPLFSEHARQVLAAAGYADGEIDALMASGVVSAGE